MTRTVIIGGGVIGLNTAYELVRAGEEVTVVDARKTGLGASEVNAGWVVPSCAAPVPGPGVVLQSLKWMLKSDSPLYVKPSLDPQFVRFMLTMLRRCNARDQKSGLRALLRLFEGTMQALDEYKKDGLEFGMDERGLLMAYCDHEKFSGHAMDLDIERSYGLEPQVLEGAELRAQEPLLSDAVCGAIYFPKERFVDPGPFAVALREGVEKLGGKVVENAPIDRVMVRGDSVDGVCSGSSVFEGDAYVLAAGAWTGRLSELFGVPLPIRGGKGYCVEGTPVPLRSAVYLTEAKVAVTPFADRLRLSGTMEMAGVDEDVNRVRVDAIARGPQSYFRDWTPTLDMSKARAGIRPMSPDGVPVLGRLGRLRNAFVATGHVMLGVTLSWATATVLRDLVLHGQCSPALEPFSPKRFLS